MRDTVRDEAEGRGAGRGLFDTFEWPDDGGVSGEVEEVWSGLYENGGGDCGGEEAGY